MAPKLMVLFLVIMVLVNNVNAAPDRNNLPPAVVCSKNDDNRGACTTEKQCTFFADPNGGGDSGNCLPICENIQTDAVCTEEAYCFLEGTLCKIDCGKYNGDQSNCDMEFHCDFFPTDDGSGGDCVPVCGYYDVNQCNKQNHCIFAAGECIEKPRTCDEYVASDLHSATAMGAEGLICRSDSTPCWGKHCENECCFTQCFDYTNDLVGSNCIAVDDAARLYCNNGNDHSHKNCKSLCCKCSSHSNKNTCDNADRSCHFASDTCKEGEDSSKPAAIKNVIIDADKVEVEFEGEDSNRRLSEENSLAGRRKRE